MRKLLFLISVLCLVFLAYSCGNRKSAKESLNPIQESDKANLNVTKDTAYSESSSNVVDSTAAKRIMKKKKVAEAPQPNSPDQEKIDSIKAAKAKVKTNF